MTKQGRWAKLVGDWERSGHSQREFCRRRRLALSTFQWWRRKLHDAPVAEGTARFLPLELAAPAAAPVAVIEVELRSRTRLRLEGEAALRAVAMLVERIR